MRDIRKLISLRLVEKQGAGAETVYVAVPVTHQPRSVATEAKKPESSKSSQDPPQKEQQDKPIFSKETTETKIKATRTGDAPPLVNLKITNPVTYLIRWWKKVIGNEGIEIKFKLKPFTAVLLTIVIIGLTTGGYGLAGILWFVNKTPLRNTPIVKYLPQPTPTPNPWRETAFTATLRNNARGYAFLTTEEGEGITLILPKGVDLTPYVNRRILAVGLYNDKTNTLKIDDVSGLELLPYYVETIPTPNPTPSPVPTLRPIIPSSPSATSTPISIEENQ